MYLCGNFPSLFAGLLAFAAWQGVVSTPSTILHAPNAYYPRATLLNDSLAIATMETPTSTELRISTVHRVTATNGSTSWLPLGIVATASLSAEQDPDLANGFPLWLSDNIVLCAYRHHNGTGSERVYRIQLSQSHDGGATWSFVTTITSGPTGVWEPFLYQTTVNGTQQVLRVAYSAEITNGGEQDIVQQESTDNGWTWSPVISRIHTPLSRNGMPGIAALKDGSLLVVFEGFWTGVWGQFTVNSMRSFDGGYTFEQPAIVYASNTTYNAGSPQVAICAEDYRIVTVFMCDAPTDNQLPVPAVWPAGAHVETRSTFMNIYNTSTPLSWNNSPAVPIAVATASAYWPSLFVDITSVGSHSATEHTMRLAYQGDDSAAYLLDGTLCLD